MPDLHETFEIRCPVHGFIPVDSWEWELINHAAFQRLRRVRQLALTDMVYPGANHTRFEHSLGVMHVGSLLYDAIVRRSKRLLQEALTYDEYGFRRDRKLVRLAALLHDVGHSPFSHAGEQLFPFLEDGKERFRHEHYSAAVIRGPLRAVIEEHPLNQNYGLRADDVAALIEGRASASRSVFWRELISGQLDVDRIDYLLRDSLHTGVDYGKFDWRRLVNSVEAVRFDESRGLRLGVAEGGFHAAEGLVLARYFMFTQVYFHKTRVAFDHHLLEALRDMLPGGLFPRPLGDELDQFLPWDDWKVVGMLAAGQGGEHGRRIRDRDHFREVYHTSENPDAPGLEKLRKARERLGDLVKAEEFAEKSWYKVGPPDIPVISDNPGRPVVPLSECSNVVKNLKPTGKIMLFARNEDKEKARDLVGKLWEAGT